VGGIYYFARMLDKIRLHARGELSADYHANFGVAMDGRCTKYLHVRARGTGRTREGRRDRRGRPSRGAKPMAGSFPKLKSRCECLRLKNAAGAMNQRTLSATQEQAASARAMISRPFHLFDWDEKRKA